MTEEISVQFPRGARENFLVASTRTGAVAHPPFYRHVPLNDMDVF
jgi:hypothetical protein